ncbi:MAG TPA: methyltransferase domain-containing protein [Acidimicrobiales bacterium]
MSSDFYLATVRRLLAADWLRPSDDVLVVAGGTIDRDVLLTAGLRSVTISNLDERMRGDEYRPFRWSHQDAETLEYPDGSFDVCVVHQGLHHCRSPHRGLLEMYRVARRGIIVFEPQDTLLTRIGVRLGVGQRYELAAVADNDLRWGGVQNTDVPNFVYRWTEREARKTLASYDPTGEPRLQCFHDLRLPGEAASRLRRGPARLIARAAVPAARAVLRLVPSQANAIAVVADKLDPAVDAHPWVTARDGVVTADADWFRRRAEGARTRRRSVRALRRDGGAAPERTTGES